MAHYRKKPVVIEAFQITAEGRGSNEHWPAWLHEAWNKPTNEVGAVFPEPEGSNDAGALVIFTLEGKHFCDLDDYIIKGVKGELYPCKPDIFELTYEPA